MGSPRSNKRPKPFPVVDSPVHVPTVSCSSSKVSTRCSTERSDSKPWHSNPPVDNPVRNIRHQWLRAQSVDDCSLLNPPDGPKFPYETTSLAHATSQSHAHQSRWPFVPWLHQVRREVLWRFLQWKAFIICSRKSARRANIITFQNFHCRFSPWSHGIVLRTTVAVGSHLPPIKSMKPWL